MAKKNTTKKEMVEEKTTTPIEEESEEIIEVVTLDNSPVSPIILEEETEVVPKDFAPAIPKKVSNNKSGLSVFRGRVYKELNNGRGIFADNGETFNLSDIK